MSYNNKSYRKRFKHINPDGDLDINEWRKIFVESCDPTEYTAAIELVGSWEEWKHLKRHWPHFAEVILPTWQDEQEIYMRSAAITRIMNSTNTLDAKWIAERKWAEKKPGAPTKQEKARRERINTEIDDDVSRVLRLHAVDK